MLYAQLDVDDRYFKTVLLDCIFLLKRHEYLFVLDQSLISTLLVLSEAYDTKHMKRLEQSYLSGNVYWPQ